MNISYKQTDNYFLMYEVAKISITIIHVRKQNQNTKQTQQIYQELREKQNTS